MSQVIQTHEQQFYLTKLMGFQYDIVYQTRKTNKVANALSRQAELEVQINSLTVLGNPLNIVAIRKANEEIEDMQRWHALYDQQELEAEYVVRDDLLFYQNRIVVPDVPHLKE